jgi:hypothetical protein
VRVVVPVGVAVRVPVRVRVVDGVAVAVRVLDGVGVLDAVFVRDVLGQGSVKIGCAIFHHVPCAARALAVNPSVICAPTADVSPPATTVKFCINKSLFLALRVDQASLCVAAVYVTNVWRPS